MKKFFSRPFRWAVIYAVVLTAFFAYSLLDTFVIPKSISSVEAESMSDTTSETDSSAETSAEAVISENSYKDDHISITIETVREYDTTFYVADIQVSDASYLKTAFADDTYGRNIKETTSDIAESNNAIFAINGDYYGFSNDGYVLRNGTVYRDNSSGSEALAIDSDGNFSIINEGEVSLSSLDTDNISQILSFGPALVEDGEVAVTTSSEVSKSMNSNPRTAIGQVSALHYIVIVSDGRTSKSTGLSLYQLAQEFAERDCSIAYNLDGGGSSTMYFNGKIINNPTDGRSGGEREVSDIVYIGY
jgi:exopolysaccharide biosynthesis protein